MEIKKRLLMTFLTDQDDKVSISVDNPRNDVTEAQIKACMDTILAKQIFDLQDKGKIAKLVEAKIVETGTTEFDLVL